MSLAKSVSQFPSRFSGKRGQQRGPISVCFSGGHGRTEFVESSTAAAKRILQLRTSQMQTRPMSRFLMAAIVSILVLGGQGGYAALPAPPSAVADGVPEPVATIQVASLEAMQKAIEAAKPGDQIRLADGVYMASGVIT